MTREDAIKTLRELWRETNDTWYEEVYNMAIEALQAPTDGDVIRCKDCKHRDLFSCPLTDNDFQKDEDFCSWGERRGEVM